MLRGTNHQDRHDEYSIFFGLLLVLIVHATILWINMDAFLYRFPTTDFDGYWHLLRAEKLYETKNIYNMTLDRSNAPYGEDIHWTSAFDLILFIGAYVGSFFAEFKDALYWWSVFLNPILHILTYLVMVFSLREFLGDGRSAVLGCFFAFQQHITTRFYIGIPDHHGILLFFFAILFGWTIRIIVHGASRKLGVAYGIMAALAMWSGIETIVVLALSLLSLGITWLFCGSDTRHSNLTILISLLLSTILTIAIDTPVEQLIRIEYDKRSIVHVTLWFLMTGYWAAVFLLEKYSSAMSSQRSRLTAAAIGAISCILVMVVLFPTVFRSPTTNIDPLVKSIYLDVVNEFRPIFSAQEKFPSQLMVSWVLAFAGVPVCFFLSWRSRGKRRYAWCYIAFLSTVYLGLAACTRRWFIYCQFISIIPICYLSIFPIDWIKSNMQPIAKTIARPLLIAILCSSFWSIPLLFDSTAKRLSLLHDTQFLRKLCQYLNEDPYFKSSRKRILTSIYLGPLLLYATPHEIVGTPAHRNENGIIDTYKVMNAEDEKDAHSVIKKRGVDALLIGRPENGIHDYFNEKKIAPMVIFHGQLWNGTIPKWLEPLSLPESLSENVKVFKILS